MTETHPAGADPHTPHPADLDKHGAPADQADGHARMAVFEAAVRLLEERRIADGLSDVTQWVTGTEIAATIGIGRGRVLEALESLSYDNRLYLRSVAGGLDVEVLGVEHPV